MQMNSLEKSDESSSSAVGQEPIFIRRRVGTCAAVLVVAVSLAIIWGVSAVPAVFFFSPRAEPPEQPRNPGNSTQGNASIHPMPPPSFPCNEPLVFSNASGRCELTCPFVAYTPGEEHALDILNTASIAISLLAFLFILATWVRIKTLLAFPHIIPLYIQGLSSLIAFVMAIGNGMGRESAFCSSKFLSESHLQPTGFCTFQGVVIHYASNALVMWFMVHTINLVKMTCSSVTVDTSRTMRSHIISSVVCWLLPVIPVIIALTSDEKYNVEVNMRFCFLGGSHLVFYTQVVITEIAQAIGCTCLFVVAYKLFTVREVPGVTGTQADRRKTKMDRVLIRLVCLLFIYAVCSALTYIPISVQIHNEKVLGYYIQQYIFCLMFTSDCPETYRQYTYSKTSVASTLSTALFAIATICFLAFNKKSRKLWSFWISRLKLCFC